LVVEEWKTTKDIPTIIESILNYRFILRLKESGQRVRLAIDWFEGQSIDKSWNLALNKYYPNVTRVGYRAYESFPFYLCSYPIPIEREAAVIPDIIAVQGQGYISTVKEFLPELEVIVIPSFRSHHVWNADNAAEDKCQDIFTMLVTLPISEHSSARILEYLIDSQKAINTEDTQIHYLIKTHPTLTARSVLRKVQRKLPNELKFTDERSFSVLLRQAQLLITEASSTCFEAMAVAVPVIILESSTGLTYNPVPQSIPNALYRKVRTREELVAAIKSFVKSSKYEISEQRQLSSIIRSSYFEKISAFGVSRLLQELPASVKGRSETHLNISRK